MTTSVFRGVKLLAGRKEDALSISQPSQCVPTQLAGTDLQGKERKDLDLRGPSVIENKIMVLENVFLKGG